jgi:branched-chain amino acid transport system permease protein
MRERGASSMLVPSLSIAVSILIPLVVSSYATRVWTVAMMNAILAMSLSMSLSIAGVVSLGQAAFYAIGAYTAAVLSTRLGIGAPWTLLLGGILAAFAGTLLAAPSLRLRGMYFMLSTMAFGEVVRLAALNWTGLTHGPMGITGIQGIRIFGRALSITEYYWTALFVAVVCYYFCEFISRSDYGLACKSMRDDDLAASVIGMNVPVLRISAAAMACFWAGIAGALYAHLYSFVSPTPFNTGLSLTILVISMLGALLGPVFGRRASYVGTFVSAIVLTWLLEGLRFLQEYRMAFYGLIMLLLVVMQPQVQALARSFSSHFSNKERSAGAV